MPRAETDGIRPPVDVRHRHNRKLDYLKLESNRSPKFMAPIESDTIQTMITAIERKWMTPDEAARLAETTARTMTDWCERYRLGRKIGGRWRISPDLLAVFLKGAGHVG